MEPTLLNTEGINSDSESLLTCTDPEINDGKEELSNTINKEIDKIFGPAIQRNRSSSDIEIVAPLKHKRRHYWSQERLFADKPLQLNQVVDVSNQGLNSLHIDELRSTDDAKFSQIPILHENQRAEIVASVTERLYSKLKKNDRIIPKIESALDKKNTQPLNELKICSNARQRLMELSQKALRNKRRIGIPASTQTKNQVTRVKNQGNEIQTDLQSLINYQNHSYSIRKDASIATEAIIPRLKEKSVGSNYSTLNKCVKDTSTQTNMTLYGNSFTMTEVIKKYDQSTQTLRLPQSRKKNSFRHLRKRTNKITSLKPMNDDNLSPIININISPICSLEPYSSEDISDDDSFSQEETDSSEENSLSSENSKATTECENRNISLDENENINEFSEDQCPILPRVMVDPERNVDLKDYESLILGQNKNIHPYNIKLSPYRQIEESKRVIKFQNTEPAEGSSSTSDNDIKSSISLYPEMTEIKSPEADFFIEKNSDVTSLKNYGINLDKTSTVGTVNTQIEREKLEDIAKEDILERENIIPQNYFKPLNKLKDIKFRKDNAHHSLNSFFNKRNTKPTPTKYLHYLIQKRREAIATDTSFKYQRNVSF